MHTNFLGHTPQPLVLEMNYGSFEASGFVLSHNTRLSWVEFGIFPAGVQPSVKSSLITGYYSVN